MSQILIVDDHPDLRNAMSLALTAYGYGTAEAANGRAALQWLEQNPPPQLILLDEQMPLMDGREFVRAFRADPRFDDVPVVMLSGREADEEVEGVKERIRKPVPVKELLALAARYGSPAREPRKPRVVERE